MVLRLVLLFGLALPLAACGARRSAPAAPMTCRTSLTLTLIPGVHAVSLPALGSTLKLAKDVPRHRTVLRLPLYPGMQRSAQTFPSVDVGYIADPYLKSASATFLSPSTPARLVSWYRRAFRGCGYLASVGNKAYVTSPGTSDVIASVQPGHSTDRQVTLLYRRVSGRTLVLYWAQEVVPPPRPAGSYLSANIVRIHVNNPYPDIAGWGTTTTPAVIRALARAVNRLPVATSIPLSCTAQYSGPLVLTFYPRRGHPITVTDNVACGGIVRIGRFRALRDDPGGIVDTLRRHSTPEIDGGHLR